MLPVDVQTFTPPTFLRPLNRHQKRRSDRMLDLDPDLDLDLQQKTLPVRNTGLRIMQRPAVAESKI
jgi:hypothetical protein